MPPAVLRIFSNTMKSRIESLQLAQHTVFDVLVIGGGITGAAVANAAQAAGLSTLLIEKGDFACQASGATNQTLTGGRSYIHRFSSARCRQLAEQQNSLEKSAPHLMRNINFVVPLAKRHAFLSFPQQLQLVAQDILTWPPQLKQHFKLLNCRQLLNAAPALSAAFVSGALQFEGCITDDARLVLTTIGAACQQGAVAINYLEARGFTISDGSITAARCHDRYTGSEFAVRAKTIVNASGAAIDDVCRLVDEKWDETVSAHRNRQIVLPASAFETNVALCLPEGENLILVVPWQHALLVGRSIGQSEQSSAGGGDADEIDYLLHVVNQYTQTHQLNRSDTIGRLTGLKPAWKNRRSNADSPPVVYAGPCGMINVVCHDLSDFMLAANDVLRQVTMHLKETQAKPVSERSVFGFKSKQEFLTVSTEVSTLGRRLSLDPATIDHLLANYGADALVIMAMIERDGSLAERLLPDYTPIGAEIIFSVQHEMAGCLQDFLIRRTRLGIINRKQTLQAAPRVAGIMQQLLDWDKKRLDAELSGLEQALADAVPDSAEAITR